jgi:hypothetical protein
MRADQVRSRGDEDKYVLARPAAGPVDSVPEGTCTADAGADALGLEDAKQAGINDDMVGRWVEITGMLEKETSSDPDNLRELDVQTVRFVPVEAPRVAAAPAPPPRPVPPIVEQPAVLPPPEPAPPVVAAPEVRETLPKTASRIPAFALLGLFSLAGAFVLRSFRLRESR